LDNIRNICIKNLKKENMGFISDSLSATTISGGTFYGDGSGLTDVTLNDITTAPAILGVNINTASDYLGITAIDTLNDEASNYISWTNGSNQGTGFNPWVISAQPNTGVFLGNPASDGMGTTGIGTNAFALFATDGSNYVSTSRTFTTPLSVGEVFSFYWAINFDANGGNKGFDLKAGGVTIFNANNNNTSTITSNLLAPYNIVDGGYGTTPMLVTLTRDSSTQYTITITSRSGGPTYSAPINSSLAINELNFYCGAQSDGLGQRNLFFNKLEITQNVSLNKISVDELKIALNVSAGLYSAGTGTDSTLRINTSNFANGSCSIVAGGYQNTSSCPLSTISGGRENTTSGNFSTISGGYQNKSIADFSTVSGGLRNTVSGYIATVSGGRNNTSSCCYSTINGGIYNTSTGNKSTVGGGGSNEAIGENSTVGGGCTNRSQGIYSTVGGGFENKTFKTSSTVGGGERNTVSCYRSTISGGYKNTTSGNYATIGGGYFNTASGCYSFIGSGNQNNVGTMVNTISGYGTITYNGTISGTYNVSPSSQSFGSGTGASFQINLFSGTISGYYSPTYAGSTASGYYGPFAPTSAGIPGGSGAQFSFNFSPPGTLSNVYIISGGVGYTNGDTLTFDGSLFGGSSVTDDVTIGITSSTYATVSGYNGGQNYETNANLTFLGSLFGGSDITDDVVINNITTSSNGKMAVVIGGAFNTSSEYGSTIGGGFGNMSLGLHSTISGGYCNTICNQYSFIGGGRYNVACGAGSTVSGGACNTTSGQYSTVSGGFLNTTNGGCSSILGGRQNTTLHDCSFIIGSGICTTAANTTHMNCLNLKNIPVNPGPGTLPSGTVYRCSTTGNILHICI
jgi:hypothetical protein